jgi:DNA polymerase III epsilon subunit-like protein
MAIILSEAYRANKLELIKLINQKLHLCSMAIGKKFMKNDKNPKLIELYKFLFNKDFIQDHRALSDCVACLDCFLSMISI